MSLVEQSFTRFFSNGKWWHAHELSVATLYYKKKKINLITKDESECSIEYLQDSLSKVHFKNDFELPQIWHFFYEYGFFSQGLGDLVLDESPLAIELEYKSVNELDIQKLDYQKFELERLNTISFENYDRAFQKGHEHLMRGDCYQYNLTFADQYKIHGFNDVHQLWQNLARSLQGTGNYAHISYLPQIDSCFISNSPECLFDLERCEDHLRIETRPIKGTYSLNPGESADEGWGKLQSSVKDQAELFMIIDLLRNDMYKIEQSEIHVRELKKKLLVPGIVHQMGILEGQLSFEINLNIIMQAMFPGGSITGAPKKRVMEILNQLENSPRGFYCGSTVIAWKNIIKASINIRSAHLSLKDHIMTIQAGGGITLLSKNEQEFSERQAKIDSFLVRIR